MVCLKTFLRSFKKIFLANKLIPEDGYEGFIEYFERNKSEVLARHKGQSYDFQTCLNKVIKKIHSSKNEKTHRKAVAVAIIGRVAKYLFTSHEMILFGHVEESRILLRNAVELLLIAYLVDKSDDVYSRWSECFRLREKNTSVGGLVLIKKFKDKKYEVNEIIKKNKNLIDSCSIAKDLRRIRGEFSTYYSHENLYNIATRVESSEGKIEIYVGQGAKAENDRTQRAILSVVELIDIANRLLSEIKEEEQLS
jgi:hypothetical protein